MPADPEERLNELERARTNEAFEVAEPVQHPRIGPRAIPIIVTVAIGILLIGLIFVGPG
jgi:hypothetical protein